MHALGSLDEANAAIGAAVAMLPAQGCEDLTSLLESLQADLFELGASLASPEGQAHRQADPVGRLEAEIDRLERDLPALRNFILPGGSPPAAQLHLARCVCRRAERAVVTLATEGAEGAAEAVTYLNRLSDLLFVAARTANRRMGVQETMWKREGQS